MPDSRYALVRRLALGSKVSLSSTVLPDGLLFLELLYRVTSAEPQKFARDAQGDAFKYIRRVLAPSYG